VSARITPAENAALKFREDLHYRLSGFPIEIPPLRERVEDIAQMGAHFLEQCAAGGRARNCSLLH
jgi:transcriptional regulator with GAF, ATPase, and Fis domain